MLAYIIRRLLLIIPTLFGVMLLSFLIIQAAPGGPVERILAELEGTAAGALSRVTEGVGGDFVGGAATGQGGEQSRYRGARGLDPEFIAKLEKQFGFDKPAYERFALMLWNYIRFDFGESYFRDVSVVGQSMSDTFETKEAIRGDVRAFDVRTGALKWVFHTVPQAGEFGTDSWEDDAWEYSGHAPVWSLFSADEELGYLYMPVTSPTSDMYGGHRGGDNLFGQSLVCVDATTGERIWHFQTVHHGLWDYDPPAAPILMDITVDGREIKAVGQLTKHAFLYVFDRVTGEPVWPIEERPVPQSGTPGEKTSLTQPFPTKPPAFDRQGATVDNLIDFTPELRAEALAITEQYVIGPLFTPPSVAGDGPNDTKGTIQLPGSQGGADVQGAAFDPETGYLYIPSITSPFVADVLEGNPDRTNLAFVKGGRQWIGGPRGLPLFKPPYGRITAIDMNRGEIVWMKPNGDGPRNHPAIRHLNLGPLGVPGRPAPLATGTLLFIGQGSTILPGGARVPDGMPPEIVTNYGGRLFRAYDKANGDVVWETELAAGTIAPPVTYMAGGKQYLLVASGDVNTPGEILAFALP